jgi:hypothetical protein
MNDDDLNAARAKLASARGLVRMYIDRTLHMNEIARSRRLEHGEMVQLAHQFRATQIARDRAMDDARGWRRIVDRLEGRPEPKGSVSLARTRAAKPGYLTRTTGRSSGSIGLGGRGSVSLGRTSGGAVRLRTAGPGYLTRMMGPS